VSWAAGRYIAAYEDACLHRFAPPPPFQGTGARLIFHAAGEGLRGMFSPNSSRGLCPDPVVL